MHPLHAAGAMSSPSHVYRGSVNLRSEFLHDEYNFENAQERDLVNMATHHTVDVFGVAASVDVAVTFYRSLNRNTAAVRVL